MKVLRTVKQEVKKFRVGDRIKVGKYTATCQKVTKKKALFCMDQYLDDSYQMNKDNTNAGGWELSDLRGILQTSDVLDIFEDLIDIMVPFKNGDLLRIPYAEELFGKLGFVMPSKKKQWKLMKDRKNRIAIRESDSYEWGWLMNKVEDSTADFALVLYYGVALYTDASGSYGVRPVFGLTVEVEE